MGLFWDFLKFGLPTAGAVGLGAWAYKRGWKPAGIGLAAVGGWGVGYGLYWGASRAADHVEGLPTKVMVPQVGQFSGPPFNEVAQAPPASGEFAGPAGGDPRNTSPYWDVKTGAGYDQEVRGKNGQPPDRATVIDMTTRKPVQETVVPPTDVPAPPPPAAPPAHIAGPKQYDPGDSFGSGGSQGGI